MQFLVIYHPPQRFADEGPPDDWPAVDAQEQVRAQELYADGRFRQGWALADPLRGAAVVYEVGSRAELDAINASYPLVRHRYAEFEVYPLDPYPGFAPKS